MVLWKAVEGETEPGRPLVASNPSSASSLPSNLSSYCEFMASLDSLCGSKKTRHYKGVDTMFDTILAKQKRRRNVCFTMQLKGRLREVKVDMDVWMRGGKKKRYNKIELEFGLIYLSIIASTSSGLSPPSLSPVESLVGWERKSKLVLCTLSASFCSHFFAKAVWEVTNGCRFFFSLQKVYLLSNSNILVQNTVVNGLSKGFNFYL